MNSDAEGNLCSLAASYVDAGFIAVIDWIIPNRPTRLLPPTPRATNAADGHAHPPPGIETCRQRNALRNPTQQWQFDGYDRLQADLRCELGDTGWWFDTSHLTTAQTADQILREARQRAIT